MNEDAFVLADSGDVGPEALFQLAGDLLAALFCAEHNVITF
jgi:hypothetical protein